MSRLSAAAFASVLFVVPVLTAAVPAVTAAGLIGLALAAVGIARAGGGPSPRRPASS